MPLNRKATAQWNGDLKTGKGTFSATSGAFKDLPYSFTTRFEGTPGTNPEELIAAAHAACFSMAFSGQLGSASLTPEYVRTTATLNFEKTDVGWTAISIHLDTHAKVPGATNEQFEAAAQNAKVGCPVSRLLNTKIELTATMDK
ncbi:MAG TPA: OsmC family protein [Candidatus Thermoplasmatota archaeon]